jgi:hypothetical protein
MAESPAHRFGQIIGDALEAAVQPLLMRFADENGLYLDKKGKRVCRPGSKLTWKDLYKNTHDLDFVLERGGTDTKQGQPAAFIETAWRRYTKHSRNKAQEIQGAILPLLETYRNDAPFAGAILAGVFTAGALTQLKSLGFSIVYISFEDVVEAFHKVGIDAHFDENTKDEDFAAKVRAWDALNEEQRRIVSVALIEINSPQIKAFLERLKGVIVRKLTRIRITPLHGAAVEWKTVDEAIDFINKYNEAAAHSPLVKYEVDVVYSNGDRIQGVFAAKKDAIQFLQSYKPA